MRSGAIVYNKPVTDCRIGNFNILYQPPGSFEVHMHAACVCNEYISLRNRVLMECKPTLPYLGDAAVRLAHCIGKWLGPHQPADGEWIENYIGRKKTIYRNAKGDVDCFPITSRDRFVSSFIKAEKISDPTRDPRMIQARSPRFNYALGNYLKPIEHKLYNIKGTRQLRHWLPKGRLIAKGRDLRSRARLLLQKMSLFPETWCISIDASRFDAHVTKRMLQAEHTIYETVYGNDKQLRRLLSYQINNRGVTKNGIKYMCPGGRMSGDMNTALGNCMLMVLMLGVTMRQVGLKPSQWNMLCDGDDTLIFLPHNKLHLADQILGTLEGFGHKIKFEGCTKNPYEVTFCQGQVIETYEGPKFVQTPSREMSRLLCSAKHYREPKSINKVLAQIGHCSLAINMGVPVLQSWALAILRNSKGAKPWEGDGGYLRKAAREIKSHNNEIHPLPITTEARYTFQEAFGYTERDQYELERLFDTVVF